MERIVFGETPTEPTLEETLSEQLLQDLMSLKDTALTERDLVKYLLTVAAITDVKNPAHLKWMLTEGNLKQAQASYIETYIDAKKVIETATQETTRIRSMYKQLPEKDSKQGWVQFVIQKEEQGKFDTSYRILARFPPEATVGYSKIPPETTQLIYLTPSSACVTEAIRDLLEENNTVFELPYRDLRSAIEATAPPKGSTFHYSPGKTSSSDYVYVALHGGFTPSDMSYTIPTELI